MRPSYANLIRHPWLSELLKPPTIAEDAEAEAAAEAAEAVGNLSLGSGPAPDFGVENGGEEWLDTADKEVATWAIGAIEKKRLGKLKGAKKPALHAAPLDAVPGSPESKVSAVTAAEG